MTVTLDDILAQNGHMPRLGDRQDRLLRKLAARCNEVIRWDGRSAVPATAAALLVTEAAHAARVETLIASLHENSLVILPYGENPAFDTLKSRLHAHGSVGAEGGQAPHQIWWGGLKPPAVPTGLYRKEDTLFISAYRNSEEADHAALLTHDLRRLGLDHAIIPAPKDRFRDVASKAEIILGQWATACRPVFWLDPHTRLAAHPLLPQATGCDVAIHQRRNGAMTCGALFFHQTDNAKALLDIWQRLCCSHDNLPESFLLDQAWAMTASQRQIETTWLPEPYWQTDDDNLRAGSVIIAQGDNGADDHPLAPYAIPMQSGRRFARPNPPEAHVVMNGTQGGRGLITIVIRDVLAADAGQVAGAVEAAASAFVADNGGFSQMEIVLCGWNEDVDAVLQIEDYSWVLLTDASERMQPDIFRALSRDSRAAAGRPQRQMAAADAPREPEIPSMRLIDPALGARIKRGGRAKSFLRRPDGQAAYATQN